MKCIQCQTENNLKDRTGNQGRCKNCNHPFVFEPTAMQANAKITDAFFAKAIADLSINQTLAFTPKQLYYFLDRRLRSRTSKGGVAAIIVGCLFLMLFTGLPLVAGLKLPLPIYLTLFTVGVLCGFSYGSTVPRITSRARRDYLNLLLVVTGLVLAIGLPWSLSLSSLLGYGATATLAIAGIWLWVFKKQRSAEIVDEPILEWSVFQDGLTRWQQTNGAPAQLLPPPSTTQSAATVQPDVSAYSFDRLVVCDTSEVAQMLIRNQFHFEHNCAILSVDGYPEPIFDTVMTMVRRNPDLKIYALHNCSAQGVQLVHQLRTHPQWFPDGQWSIVDVGILPRQILRDPNIAVRRSPSRSRPSLPLEVSQTLTPEELTWLDSGRYIELQSFSPQRLIQILQRAIAQNHLANPIESDGGFLFIGDTGSGFYTTDSFG
jgi:hypothetical protein